jgi:YidC/Oxa1 family membrane protein insertase
MDTRRAILWIVFSLSLLMLWDAYMRHSGQGSMFGGEVQSTAPQNSASPSGSSPNGPTATVPAASQAIQSAAVPTPPVPANSTLPVSGQATPQPNAEKVVLKNQDIELEIDLVGARITRAVLLNQASDDYEGNRVVLFDQHPERRYEAQSGLTGQTGARTSYPNHTSVFKRVDTIQSSRSVTMVAESGGVKLTKTYGLDETGFVVKVSHTVQNTGADEIAPQIYLQLMRTGDRPPGESQFYQTFIGPAVYTDKGKFEKIDFSDIEKNKASHEKTANNGWFGIIQHYFVSAWVPRNEATREFYTRRIDNNLYNVGLIQALPAVAPGAQQTHEAILFAGPQFQDVLEQLAPGLELVVDYGWLTFLAKPIYWLLEQLHGFVGNWGWAIVLLTIIIKAVFYPLSAASYKSMAKMKAVTPRLVKLREVYANDRAKLNQAMMELYKTEKINPLGGCLPILIQIPVFIALYWVLLASVEMRNAPWLGWVTDLSTPDPYFILPVVMAVTMFIQTKLNPPPPDPLQAKVMMAMPIVFSIFFFFFPAGLVLYWLVNNVLSIAQQWYVMKSVEKAAAAHR